MKLSELSQNHKSSTRALKEHFELDLKLSKLTLRESADMLNRVRRMMKEAKSGPDFYKKANTPTYMKMVFMEQALSSHYEQLVQIRNLVRPQIVVENEEVDKSQVVLAAQDMVDTVQKMIEQVSDMMVKELPALVDSVNSEIGTSEGEQFNQSVTEALRGLQDSLNTSKTGLSTALGIVTGQGNGQAFSGEENDEEMPSDQMPPPEGDDMMGDEMPPPENDDVMGDEMPDEEPEPNIGRARR